jgi:nucleoside-diphosphate-sugar epimerase
MHVIITGAAGQIGSQLVEELSPSHELRLVDLRPVKGRRSIVADLSRRPVTSGWRSWFKSRSSRWNEAFEGAQVVVHLAADSQSLAPWEKVLPDNIQATWNILEAAAIYRVPRVVFASSNWAVKAVENRLAPSCYDPTGPKIDSETPPFALTDYGLSKAFGELAGRMFVDEGKLESFVAVRIGNHNRTPSTDEIVRARWIGVEDTKSLFRRCVEADIKGFHVVYGVSGQNTIPYDLSHTQQLLSWFPTQLPDDRLPHKISGVTYSF